MKWITSTQKGKKIGIENIELKLQLLGKVAVGFVLLTTMLPSPIDWKCWFLIDSDCGFKLALQIVNSGGEKKRLKSVFEPLQ